MKKKKMYVVLGILAGLLLSASILSTKFTPYTVSRRVSADEYAMDYNSWSTKDSASLTLKKGEHLTVDLANQTGRLDVEISHQNGEIIYTGHDAPKATFNLPIAKDGTYTISVKGKQANGRFHFKKESN